MSKRGFFVFGAAALLVSSVASYASLKTSTVDIPGGGGVGPTKTLSLPLVGLVPRVYYDVTCSIKNETDQPVAMKFGIRNGDVMPFDGAFILNNVDLPYNNQGMLKPGVNESRCRKASAVTPSIKTALTFQNLDIDSAVSVYNCFAKPAM